MRHAAVIRFSSLGDIVLTTPVLETLKTAYPGLELTYITKEKYGSLLHGHPCVDRLELLRDNEQGVMGLRRLAGRLRGADFDLVVDLHAVPRSYLLGMFLKKKRLVRYDKQRRLRKKIVRNGHRAGSSVPTTRKYLACLPDAASAGSPLPALHPTDTETVWAADLLGSGGEEGPLVAVHPGAAWPGKRWPGERFRALMDKKKEDWRFVLVGGTADQDIIREHGLDRFGIPAAGRTTPGQLAALLARCRVLIAGDTGPVHTAGAVGCGTVVLFGPTHPALGFAPVHRRTRILCTDEQCSPCSLHGREACRFGDRHCLTGITVNAVIRAAEELITE